MRRALSLLSLLCGALIGGAVGCMVGCTVAPPSGSVDAGLGRDAGRDGGALDAAGRDTDENGIPDAVEGQGDWDGDGLPDFADEDDDQDFLRDSLEIGEDPSAPADFDGDGTPDFRDPDCDRDRILDGDDGDGDSDRDGIEDRFDPDSDNDGLPDLVEAGDADLYSAPIDSDGDLVPDFRDPDSDNDGLDDRTEAELGTDPREADSDGDGVSDLIELRAGTDPLDRRDSPLARGDRVFALPYEGAPFPEREVIPLAIGVDAAEVRLEAVEEEGDEGDALPFLERLEATPAEPGCDAAFEAEDRDGDGYKDTFLRATAGASLCWALVPRGNDRVEGGELPLIYRLRLRLLADGVELASERIYFVVPPPPPIGCEGVPC